jgi:hypothetical protein
MRRPILSVALFLLLLANARGETIRFDPPNPTTHHSVDAMVAGIWHDGCLPAVKSIAVNGSTISLHLNADLPPGASCPQSLVQYARTFHLEILPAGSYTVIAFADANGGVSELARTTLIVREAEALTIRPYALPPAGGIILIDNPFFPASATVTIGGEAIGTAFDNDRVHLTANAPPRPSGSAVDVVVTSAAGTVTAKSALIYYDPDAADPAVFEPILFPLSFQGAGAFGSQWTTESFLLAGSPAFFRDPLPCSGCSTRLSANAQLANNANPWGHVLYALRGTTSTVDVSSRIRDTSRQALTAGTEVPVVHERDFRGQIRFPNVPVDARFRTTLRLWALDDFPQFIVQVDPGTNIVAPLSVTLIPGTAMYFGTADLTPLLPQAKTTPVTVTIFPSGFPSTLTPVLFPPIWGMLSITNNDTQQVTILSP